MLLSPAALSLSLSVFTYIGLCTQYHSSVTILNELGVYEYLWCMSYAKVSTLPGTRDYTCSDIDINSIGMICVSQLLLFCRSFVSLLLCQLFAVSQTHPRTSPPWPMRMTRSPGGQLSRCSAHDEEIQNSSTYIYVHTHSLRQFSVFGFLRLLLWKVGGL